MPKITVHGGTTDCLAEEESSAGTSTSPLSETLSPNISPVETSDPTPAPMMENPSPLVPTVLYSAGSTAGNTPATGTETVSTTDQEGN